MIAKYQGHIIITVDLGGGGGMDHDRIFKKLHTHTRLEERLSWPEAKRVLFNEYELLITNTSLFTKKKKKNDIIIM